MTGKTTYHASVESTNTVNFGSPYDGEQHARLSFRTDPKHGKDVIFRIRKGQLLCSSYAGCPITVMFDDEKALTYSGTEPADHS